MATPTPLTFTKVCSDSMMWFLTGEMFCSSSFLLSHRGLHSIDPGHMTSCDYRARLSLGHERLSIEVDNIEDEQAARRSLEG